MLFKRVDVSAITGEHVAGDLVSWQTKDGIRTIEHVAGPNKLGDLIVFWWSPQHDWQSVNVSSKTGIKITGAPTSWQTPNGPYMVEHLAAASTNGDLIVFWWSSQHDWQAINVSQKTGQNVTSGLTSWQTPNGPYNIEHIAAVTPAGHLCVFWWSSQHDWQVADVTRKTGEPVATAPTSWETPNGPYLVEHLAATNANGDLITYWWSSQHDWQAINISKKTGQKCTSTPTSWQTTNGPYLVEHLAATSPGGNLVAFWWSPQHDWQTINVSQKTGQVVVGAPTSWTTLEKGVLYEYLACEGPNGSFLVFWWSPPSDWQKVDNTFATRETIGGILTSWQTGDSESPRDLRRLQLLREWSHEQVEQVFT